KGRLTEYVDIDGKTTTYFYDDATDKVVKSYSEAEDETTVTNYNAKGQAWVIKVYQGIVVDPANPFADTLLIETTYEYNTLGNILSYNETTYTRFEDGTPTVQITINDKIKYYYTSTQPQRLLYTEAKDRYGDITKFYYNASTGALYRSYNAQSNSTSFYDNNSNLTDIYEGDIPARSLDKLKTHYDYVYTSGKLTSVNQKDYKRFEAGKGVYIGANDPYKVAAENNINLSEGTIEMWINPEDLAGDRNYFHYGKGNGFGSDAEINITGNSAGLQFYIGTAYSAGDKAAMAGKLWNQVDWSGLGAGKWVHITATYKIGGKMNLYVNGELKASADMPSEVTTLDSLVDPINTNDNIIIGGARVDSASNHGYATFDNVKIFGEQKNDFAIASDYLGDGTTADLLLNLDFNTPGVVLDSIPAPSPVFDYRTGFETLVEVSRTDYNSKGRVSRAYDKNYVQFLPGTTDPDPINGVRYYDYTYDDSSDSLLYVYDKYNDRTTCYNARGMESEIYKGKISADADKKLKNLLARYKYEDSVTTSDGDIELGFAEDVDHTYFDLKAKQQFGY
ncbi:MAG: LamG domain-containing protein, partial [Candidatus Omnitrophota bacterium]|nr:LamG domain-containing protein [Candidatus Omnitrophota bacterium]